MYKIHSYIFTSEVVTSNLVHAVTIQDTAPVFKYKY